MPLPSSPDPLPPQAMTVPSLSSARLCTPPPETAVTPLNPLTLSGLVLHGSKEQVSGPLSLSMPSCPSSFAPQALTVPSLSSASAWLIPADTDLTPLPSPLTVTGTVLFVVLPLPSSP